jgi:hypothetical protein
MYQRIKQYAQIKIGLYWAVQKQRERVCDAAADFVDKRTEENEVSLIKEVHKLRAIEYEYESA